MEVTQALEPVKGFSVRRDEDAPNPWVLVTSARLANSMTALERSIGPATPENYDKYAPTIAVLSKAEGPVGVEEVVKATGRRFAYEFIVLNNLAKAGLAEKSRKRNKNLYRIQSIKKVQEHFKVGPAGRRLKRS